MTELNPPTFLQNRTDHTAQGDRLLLGGLFVRSGVALGTDFTVTAQGSPNMTVNVSSGHAYIAGTQSAHQGYYHCYNDATVVETIASSSPTQSRVDLIVARVRDQFYSGSDNDWLVDVVQGTPGSPGVPPSLPANAISLAQINIAAAATSITNANIVRTAPYVGTRGGIVFTSNQTERDALTAFPGLVVFRSDLSCLEFYDGTIWRGGSNTPHVQVFTGSGTWTKPSGARRVKITCVGGGGGGGGCAATGASTVAQSGGGAGGGTSVRWVDASTLGATVAVTVGAGGAAGAAGNNNGSTGVTSSFGTACIAFGGAGGTGSSAVSTDTVNSGGLWTTLTGMTADFRMPGDDGGAGVIRSGLYVGDNGGGGTHLGGRRRGPIFNGVGEANLAYGGGGPGSTSFNSTAARAGTAGTTGLVIVETFF